MPFVVTDDAVRLYYETIGDGEPLVFLHEFAGDYRSWEDQVRFFGRRYRVIVFNARGYPPSDVPESVTHYSQQRATDDLRDVLDGLGIARAHVCGMSMSGYTALQFAGQRPERVLSLILAGAGQGSSPTDRARFQREVAETAAVMRRDGMARVASWYARGPSRVQFEAKDPIGFARFEQQLAEHSSVGSANTFLGVQAQRPSIIELADALADSAIPTLVITGDEDDQTLEPALYLKRVIPACGLMILPKTGHTLNLEEPAAFNAALLDFLTAVAAGRWTARDARSRSGSAILPPDRS